jgi:hypothetical protein
MAQVFEVSPSCVLSLKETASQYEKLQGVMLSPSVGLSINSAKHLAILTAEEKQILRLCLRMTLRTVSRAGRTQVGFRVVRSPDGRFEFLILICFEF